MRILYTLAAMVGIFTALPAQNFQWVHHFSDAASDVAIDPQGAAIVASYFTGNEDFDDGAATVSMVAIGGQDAAVAKFNAIGQFQWARQIGGSGNDLPEGLAVDAAGNSYLAGTFHGALDADPGNGNFTLTSLGGTDIFLIQLDPNGDFVWAKQFGGVGEDLAKDLSIDGSGNLYLAGQFTDTCDFDPDTAVVALISSSLVDAFVLKLNAAGQLQWVRQLSGTSDDIAHAVAVSNNGAVVVGGTFSYDCDFDPGAGTHVISTGPAPQGYVCKLDAGGNFVWAGSIRGISGTSGVYDLQLDAADDVYAAGDFVGTVDMDPGVDSTLLTAAGSGMFVTRWDASGPLVWASGYLSTNSGARLRGIGLSATRVYASCKFSNNIDLDPGPGTLILSTGNNYNQCIGELDLNGDLYAGLQFTAGFGVGFERSHLAVDVYENVYAVGSFANTADFDPGAGNTNTSSGSDVQAFLVKLGYCAPSADTLVARFCDSIVVNGQTFWNPGNYVQHLISRAGCDSTLTVSLTQDTISPVSILLSGNTATASVPGLAYQWFLCDSNLVSISGATNQSFSPSTSGFYAVAITNGACADTSTCEFVAVVAAHDPVPQTPAILFPNPNNGHFSIHPGNGSGHSAVEVLDILGRSVAKLQFDDQQILECNIDLQAGIYMVILTTENGRHSFQMLRE